MSLLLLNSSDLKGLELRESEDADYVYAPTGDVFVYDLFENDEYAGQICFDKATDLVVKHKNAQGDLLYSVEELKTSDFVIPAYK